jgi:hypothetical protein
MAIDSEFPYWSFYKPIAKSLTIFCHVVNGNVLHGSGSQSFSELDQSLQEGLLKYDADPFPLSLIQQV